MNITVTDNKITVSWLGKTKISEVEELVDLFKDADYLKRRRMVPMYFESSLFKTVSTKEEHKQPMSTVDLLSECAKHAHRFSNYDFGEDIDDILGADPYLPLY